MSSVIKSFILLSLFIALNSVIFSQTNVDINKKEFKIEGGKEFKKAWKEIKTAEDYFSEGIIGYEQALDHYLKAFQYNNENPELNYKIGVCYLYSGNKNKANDYLMRAYEAKPETSADLTYLLARSFHINMNFDQAVSYYRKYRDGLSPKQLKKVNENLEVGIDHLIDQCEYGKVLVRTPVRVIIDNAGQNINSQYDDYSPVVSKNDSMLLFTSRRAHSKKSKKSKYDNKYYESVYMSTKTGNEWGPAKKFLKGKKVKENTAVVGMSHDGKTVYLYKGSENGGDIYFMFNKMGKWSKPKSLPGKVNSRDKEGSAALSPDGMTLYFVSDRKKESVGGKDIFMSKMKQNGKWDKPVNLGPVINTKWDEAAVSLHPNGRVLYFSSKGHTSMGGYDVFKSEMSSSGEWSNPENIGYPLNSSEDDLFFSPSFSGRIAYFSSSRENSLGGKDIYKVNFLGEEKELIFDAEEKILAGQPDISRTIYFAPPSTMEIEERFFLTGIVSDEKTNEPVSARVSLIDPQNNDVVESATTDNGSYEMIIPEKKEYRVEATARGYLMSSSKFDPNSGDMTRNFELEKIEIGTKVVLKNIYFEPGRARLMEESYDELNKVYKFLMGNPSIRIEISGHTDNIGTLEANKRLSKARAKACVDYLVKKGIERNRLEYEGYAFLQPVSHNHDPEGRQANRRVEFKVLNK